MQNKYTVIRYDGSEFMRCDSAIEPILMVVDSLCVHAFVCGSEKEQAEFIASINKLSKKYDGFFKINVTKE